jgi:hypothetical protein
VETVAATARPYRLEPADSRISAASTGVAPGIVPGAGGRDLR